MSWRKDRKRIPGWEQLRTAVLRRDKGVCQIRLKGICTHRATEVDHIIPDSRGGETSMANCRAACHECHRIKSQQESADAATAKAARRRRPVTPHPATVVPRPRR